MKYSTKRKQMKRLLNSRYLRWFLIIFAVSFIFWGLWYTRALVSKLAVEERNKVRIWADAIQQKAASVNYLEKYYREVEKDERNRIEMWAEAYTRFLANSEADYTQADDFDYYRRVINQNTTIPFIITNLDSTIYAYQNISIDLSKQRKLTGDLLTQFSVYPPLQIFFKGKPMYLVYYEQSTIYTQLKVMMDNLLNSFISDVVENSVAVPVIITNKEKNRVLNYGNVDPETFRTPKALSQTLASMGMENKPIEIKMKDGEVIYIFYENSSLLKQLTYFPFFSFGLMFMFILLLIFILRIVRRSEEDKLWMGMTRETAHQLGTPISSLMAWVEYLKMKDVDIESIEEMNKDVKRLDIITQRFSKIGSRPELKCENVVYVIYRSVSYLRVRISKKVSIQVNLPENAVCLAALNVQLFEWVIENLCKNAVDAIGDNEGVVKVNIIDTDKHIIIDVVDNGKGMSKSSFKKIFKAGYTTKSRGWGVGLTLCKRIVRDYHKGKIFVKSSVPGKGTTFRIILKHTDICEVPKSKM